MKIEKMKKVMTMKSHNNDCNIYDMNMNIVD